MADLNQVFPDFNYRSRDFNVRIKNAYAFCPACDNDISKVKQTKRSNALHWGKTNPERWFWDYNFECENGHKWSYGKGQKMLHKTPEQRQSGFERDRQEMEAGRLLKQRQEMEIDIMMKRRQSQDMEIDMTMRRGLN